MITSNTLQLSTSLSLPSLSSVLNLPTTIDNVPLTTITSSFSVVSTDLTKMIIDIRAHDWEDTIELGFIEVLQIASIVGVPGVGIAATILPYIFDIMNEEIRGRGHVTVGMFVDALTTSQSNIGQILQAIEDRNYGEGVELSLIDLLGLAGAFLGGPYATIATLIVKVVYTFASIPNVEKTFNQFITDTQQITDVIENKPIHSGAYTWSPIWGWYLSSNT